MDLLIKICIEHKLHPAMVFFLAYEYFEIIESPSEMRDLFISCCSKDKDGSYILEQCPEFVEDFCVDILAKRTYIPTILLIGDDRVKPKRRF